MHGIFQPKSLSQLWVSRYFEECAEICWFLKIIDSAHESVKNVTTDAIFYEMSTRFVNWFHKSTWTCGFKKFENHERITCRGSALKYISLLVSQFSLVWEHRLMHCYQLCAPALNLITQCNLFSLYILISKFWKSAYYFSWKSIPRSD